MNTVALAWVAGIWDGEGSIGIYRTGTTFILAAQFGLTHLPTVQRVADVMAEHGIRIRGPYTYKERRNRTTEAVWKDAHCLRVGGLDNVRSMAELLLPYSVTKRELWEVAHEWAERRIAVAGGLDAKGNLKRGGLPEHRRYTEVDWALVQRFADLNDSRRRGGRTQSFLTGLGPAVGREPASGTGVLGARGSGDLQPVESKLRSA